MLTYKIHLRLCDDIHYIDSQPFQVANATKIITYFIYDNLAKLSLHDCNEFIFVNHSKAPFIIDTM